MHLTQQPLEWWQDLLAVRFEVTDAVPYMGGRGLCFTCKAFS